MDNFYQQYKTDDDFWDIDDFITMTGNTIASMYMQYYQQEYVMLRQERKDEVITFDVGWLAEQEAEVKQNGIGLYAILDKPVMTFPYDKSSSGLQTIFIIEPQTADELERTSLGSLWQLKYMPKTSRIFFYSDVTPSGCLTISKIGFVNKGTCNIKKIRVLYVPSMEEDAFVPDGLIADAIAKTVIAMRQMGAGNVIDKTADENQNKILQTEVNKKTLTK